MNSTLRTSMVFAVLPLSLLTAEIANGRDPDTLPVLKNGVAPRTFSEMWHGFDPSVEPLETETISEWEEQGVVMRIVRFRVGVFKGQTARLAAIYGYPKGAAKLPGLVQIHGGGQYADHKACLMNAKRSYATVSIAWAGRISAPDYRVGPDQVQLFWDGKTDDPTHKLTTDWAAVDGYHAPSRYAENQFPSAKAAAWTLDAIESPRNSGWFLCAMAARRALTFLEQQPEVDADRLGVYGHSMGGKLTVLTAPDARVKAAAPSCGGISDRDNDSQLFVATLGDHVSLKRISCPIMFLSPANDFHGRISDLPKAVKEIQSDQWRVTCAPHHNHQDTAAYEVATLLWFDQHLKGTFTVPKTPVTKLDLSAAHGVPTFHVEADSSMPIASVDIFYTQHGKPDEKSADRDNVVHRFWHHVPAEKNTTGWSGTLPVSNTNASLWVYANVTYQLPSPVAGAGYYYRTYTADSFNVSSLLQTVTPAELLSSGIQATLKPNILIEDFEGPWHKEWFTYRPDEWAITTNKLHDDIYKAPAGSLLAFEVLCDQKNTLVIMIDGRAAEVDLPGGDQWQHILLSPDQFRNFEDEGLVDWNNIKQLKLCPTERLRAAGRGKKQTRIVGGNWHGTAPVFRALHWYVEDAP